MTFFFPPLNEESMECIIFVRETYTVMSLLKGSTWRYLKFFSIMYMQDPIRNRIAGRARFAGPVRKLGPATDLFSDP